MHHNESYGKYKCLPKNEVGSAEEGYYVYVERGRQAQKPKNFTLLGVGIDSFDIYLGNLNESSDDPMRVTKYRFEMMLKDDFEANGNMWRYQNIKDVKANGSYPYLMDKLISNKTYLVRVASINLAGLSEFTNIQEFTTIAYTPIKSQKKKDSNVSNDSNMIKIPFYLIIATLFYCQVVYILVNIQ